MTLSHKLINLHLSKWIRMEYFYKNYHLMITVVNNQTGWSFRSNNRLRLHCHLQSKVWRAAGGCERRNQHRHQGNTAPPPPPLHWWSHIQYTTSCTDIYIRTLTSSTFEITPWRHGMVEEKDSWDVRGILWWGLNPRCEMTNNLLIWEHTD